MWSSASGLIHEKGSKVSAPRAGGRSLLHQEAVNCSGMSSRLGAGRPGRPEAFLVQDLALTSCLPGYAANPFWASVGFLTGMVKGWVDDL